MLQLCIISTARFVIEQWMEIQQEREVCQNDFTLWSNCSISSKIKYSKTYRAHLNLSLNKTVNSTVYSNFILMHSLKTTSQLTVFVFVNNFQQIASIFKCEMSSSLSLINCLRNQEANDIVSNSTVGETLLSKIFLMAHLQNFSSASNQSSLLACSRVEFS